MKYFWLGLLAFLLYKLIFRLIIPVYRATKQVRKKFREFEQHVQNQAPPGQQTNPEPVKKEKGNKDKDYIEFEDVSSPR
jgi:hypothetical protein